MITEYEKELAMDYSENLATLFVDNEAGRLYYKIFSNFMKKVTPMKNIQFNEQVLQNKEYMKDNVAKMLKFMVVIASDASDQTIYTTGELSRYFGVSVTSVNKWIAEGRFIGIAKGERNQHTRIPENTLWVSSTGKTIPVRDVVSMWEEENRKRMKSSANDETTEIEKDITWFENKFGGSLEETLKRKKGKTPEEETYQEQWEYLLKRSGRS